MKMQLKKLLSLLLAMMLTLSLLAACSDKAEDTGNNESESQTEATTPDVKETDTTHEDQEATEEVVPAEPVTPEELGAGDVKWSEEVTADGYALVTNEGGETLGYSPESGISLIQVEGFAFKDLNQNGLLDQYEDWRLDSQTRATDLASQLSVESIAGLTLFSSHQSAISAELTEEQETFLSEGLRSVLNANPNASTEDTALWNNAMQAFVEGDGIGIPVNTSSDPRDAGVSGVPSNLALAATFDTELVEEMGMLTSIEYRQLGITTLLGPQIDVTTEARWNRTDGTFGDDPALARDMTAAFVNGVQSTFDAEGNDLGWGEDSMNAMIKHWPGDGAGEGGREGHANIGNAQVYPGGLFEVQMIPFVDGGFELEGATEEATAVMASYSIAYDADKIYGELVGTAYSEYKVRELLREQYAYDGVVCTDWGVIDDFEGFMQGKAYGAFDLTQAERALRVILAGVDQFGGFNDRGVIVEAYEIGVDELGEDFMRERFEIIAVRTLRNVFTVGTFENPYINIEEAKSVVMNEENQAKAYEAQLKSVVMLKNEGVIAAATDEKPTVYVPMVYVPFEVSFFGQVTNAEWKLPVEAALLEEYFTVVTDTPAETLTGPEDAEGNKTVSTDDIVRATTAEITDCDFAFVMIKDPVNQGNYFDGFGYDYDKEEYIPVSLQYGPYTADSEFVRQESISGDITIKEEQSGYVTTEVEEKENRSYYGKSSIIKNYEDVNTVKYASENMPADAPVIVAVKSDGPMIFAEIEPMADAILIGFGMSIGSGYGLDERALIEVAAGIYEPAGLLPVQMPADMLTVEAQLEDVPRDMTCYTDAAGNTYDFAYGMNWSGIISDERTATYAVAALTSPAN